MRRALWMLGGLLALAVIWVGLQIVAGESGEVVILRSVDAAGATHETRLWIVDRDDGAWLRAGSSEAGWLPHLEANQDAELVRDGRSFAVLVVPVIAERDAINAQMREKYGWGDWWIGVWVSRDDSVPLRLDARAVPLDEAPSK